MSASLIHRLDAILDVLRERLPRQVPGREPDLDPVRRLAASVAFYDRIVNSPLAPLRDRLRAQERIDRLLGLDCGADGETDDPLGDLVARLARRVNEQELLPDVRSEEADPQEPPR